MPIDYGLHAHKIRPSVVRAIEIPQELTMRICPSGADKHGLDSRVLAEVGGERGLHRQGVRVEVEGVRADAYVDEVVDFGEGMRGHYVDALDRGGGGDGGRGQAGEEEEQEDETVFAAVEGDCQFVEAVGGEG